MTIKTLFLPEKPPFPNAAWPVIWYRQMFGAGEQEDFAGLFEKRGWTGLWVNGVYAFDHFHARAHEALGCVAGWADLRLGGPEGEVLRLSKGDAALLPAGTGHRNLRQSADFSVVGAYPPGQSPDMQRGDEKVYQRLLTQARSLPRPRTDPVTDLGGVLALWEEKPR